LPHGQRKKHGAKSCFTQAQSLLQIGDSACPGGKYNTLDKIKGADRNAVIALRREGKRQVHLATKLQLCRQCLCELIFILT
jgi:hypothetical protein